MHFHDIWLFDILAWKCFKALQMSPWKAMLWLLMDLAVTKCTCSYADWWLLAEESSWNIFSGVCVILSSCGLLNERSEPFFLSAYSTVSGVNGPLVILDNVKVSLQVPFQVHRLSFFFQTLFIKYNTSGIIMSHSFFSCDNTNGEWISLYPDRRGPGWRSSCTTNWPLITAL